MNAKQHSFYSYFALNDRPPYKQLLLHVALCSDIYRDVHACETHGSYMYPEEVGHDMQ